MARVHWLYKFACLSVVYSIIVPVTWLAVDVWLNRVDLAIYGPVALGVFIGFCAGWQERGNT